MPVTKKINPKLHIQDPNLHAVSLISGTYIMTAFGTIDANNVLKNIPEPPIVGPFSSVGRIEHDGKGKFVLIERICNKEKVVTEVKQGSYTVCACQGGLAVTYNHSGYDGVFARYTQNRGEGRGVSLFPGIISTILCVKE